MNLSQIQAFEPGDAEWGVKLADVRGQAEAKEEVRRVVSIWQSGEAFERAGGKRERGLLFLGAPGTGKTMLAKALATGFNSPFVSIPGSGFAATFIGIDAIVVRVLARRAKRLARKWGGQCIVFIDEIDAVGMRRQALNPGFGGAAADHARSTCTTCSSTGPRRAEPVRRPHPRDRRWRERLFAERAPQPRAPIGLATRVNGVSTSCSRAEMGGGSLALNQLLVVMDGIDNPPFFKKFFTNKTNTLLDGIYIVPRRIGGARCAPGRAPAQGADLLHRRDERARRPARPGAHAPGPHGPPRLVPHADEAGSPRHPRPLPRQGRARAGARPGAQARGDRARHERLRAGDARAGHVDGAHDRAPLEPRGA